ncbi:hypothetical protein ABZZ37_25945 [Streptomyces sp. NPDC006464]|uniref:hypothetical protein n=1 Tax=Streptomyces sp. NPDC006464 TaxID=3154305 RepID=UPI0033A6FB39
MVTVCGWPMAYEPLRVQVPTNDDGTRLSGAEVVPPEPVPRVLEEPPEVVVPPDVEEPPDEPPEEDEPPIEAAPTDGDPPPPVGPVEPPPTAPPVLAAPPAPAAPPLGGAGVPDGPREGGAVEGGVAVAPVVGEAGGVEPRPPGAPWMSRCRASSWM